MRCKIDGWMENPNCLRNCDCHRDPRNMQAGPIMVRHVIDGYGVLLPADAKLHPRLTSDDNLELSDLGGCY